MPTIIRAARILTPDEDFSPAAVLIEDGLITAVDRHIPAPESAQVIELPAATLVPGFIDLHVHGGGGFSLMADDPDEIRSYASWVVSHGVTSFRSTICAESIEQGLEFARTAATITGPITGAATLLGINLEGPFVNPARRGALPSTWLSAPDLRTFDGLVQAARGQLKAMTLAPELPHAEKVLQSAVGHAITVSIGHTDADFDTALRAFQDGALHVTHAFNAMRPFHHRDPGPIGAALQSHGVTIEVIADGVHLHPATVALLVSSFSPDRITLVTDGVKPAGLSSGTFRIGEHEATLANGRMHLPDGTIAGGAATMDQLVRNIVEWRAGTLADAVRMASATPARVVGLFEHKGRIAPGYDADLVALSADLSVLRTWVGGVVGYIRASS